MTDDDLLATCVADEAANQPYEGKVCVAVVVLNRATNRYESDGTIPGTILKKFQFSGFWFSMEAGHYVETEFNLAEAQAEAQKLYDEFSTQPIWDGCRRAVDDAKAWEAGVRMSFTPGPAFAGITRRTVLYYNPHIAARPKWATPDKLDAVIFQHNFYHA